ncbi:hypothetical protein QR680_017103 [Steinernema hermaphroditum]|uniref:LIM/homeobox protein Awh n=1 Tax=Steinernema hermaphroditum TaxID=289476 RepID=A0AA39HDB7_9BILA|nr:hypothetical protein QR680_017103 [Steinernema hermaphroditum]
MMEEVHQQRFHQLMVNGNHCGGDSAAAAAPGPENCQQGLIQDAVAIVGAVGPAVGALGVTQSYLLDPQSLASSCASIPVVPAASFLVDSVNNNTSVANANLSTDGYGSPPHTSNGYVLPPSAFLPRQREQTPCAACGSAISERTILSANQQFFHADCLRCNSCGLQLDQFPSCYVKENNIFCKGCYGREYGTKCASCSRVIQPTDWVRRARSFVYHLACFACDQCKRQLSTGEEFSLQENRLLCKQHYLETVDGDSGSQKSKTKRVRTTFAEEQLSVLQAHFQIDSNPDGADLERIASITGLSKRVTQVWFQNSRARQKKYQGGKKIGAGGNRGETDRASSIEHGGSPKSPSTDSNDGMMFPRSVTTSTDEPIMPEHLLIASSMTMETDSLYAKYEAADP